MKKLNLLFILSLVFIFLAMCSYMVSLFASIMSIITGGQ